MVPLAPPFPFVPGEYVVKLASEPWERAACRELRRAVFCDEQRIFHGDDRDEIDEVALPIVALACVAGMPDQAIGTVRIHRIGPDEWQGSRLAVHADFRRIAMIGTELIRHAVSSAHGLGCRRFIAHVQAQNVPLFRRLNWRSLSEETLHGRPHHLMEADLAHYPPRREAEFHFVTQLHRAA